MKVIQDFGPFSSKIGLFSKVPPTKNCLKEPLGDFDTNRAQLKTDLKRPTRQVMKAQNYDGAFNILIFFFVFDLPVKLFIC